MEETWKPIPNFNGYEISSKGQIHSYYKLGNHKLMPEPQRIIATRLSSSGYLCSTLTNNEGNKITDSVHKFMAVAFLGPCPEGLEVCHWDDVKLNNTLENIRYGTKKENKEDAARNGKVSYGENRYNAKLTIELVRAMREEYATGLISQKELELKYKVNQSIISEIISGKRWKQCGGLIKDVDYKIEEKVIYGENHSKAILLDTEVMKVRCLHASEHTAIITLAKRFNVSKEGISSIIYGRSRLGAGGPIRNVDYKISSRKELKYE